MHVCIKHVYIKSVLMVRIANRGYSMSFTEYLQYPPTAEKEPQTICEHLQYLFALLQNSSRRSIDPSGLVKALGLNTGQQQVLQQHHILVNSVLFSSLLFSSELFFCVLIYRIHCFCILRNQEPNSAVCYIL